MRFRRARLPGIVVVVVLLAGAWLGACSLSSEADPSQGIGGSDAFGLGGWIEYGLGGRPRSGLGGFGGIGGVRAVDPPAAECVSTCDQLAPVYVRASMLSDGGWICPPGAVLLDSCDPRACARSSLDCCDPVSGAITAAACQPDGLLHCPAGTNETNSYTCVPTELGRSDCLLDGVMCTTPGQLCSANYSNCRCGAYGGAGGMALYWSCSGPLPP